MGGIKPTVASSPSLLPAAATAESAEAEDNPENITALRDDGHDTIVVVNSTNRHLPPPRAEGWDEIERMVRERLVRWQGEEPGREQSG